MPNQFFSPEGSLEEYFATDYWLFEQYIGDQLWSWGYIGNGELGINLRVFNGAITTPVQEFTSSTNWKQVDAAFSHTAAIKTDGTLWLWGGNNSGNLGDNTTASRSTPRQEFTSSTNWKQVSTGGDGFLRLSSAAVKTDGTLWTWGDNGFGQLGINDNSDRYTPVQEFTSSTNWKQVSTAGYFMAAIKTDGTLWTWGYNGLGQLGVNGGGDRSTPVQEFTSSTNWKQVSLSPSNGDHMAAIKTDGTLWLWGLNNNGQLGVNDTTRRSTPVQEFTSSTNWKQVSCGEDYTAAIKTDGTLWSWGINSYGRLGVNDTVQRNTPVQEFTSSTNWKYVGCGGQHNTAIKTDGTLWTWGYNVTGQLGTNDTNDRSTPVQEFTSSTNWKQVSGGGFHTTAVKTGIEIDTGTLT